MFNKDLPFLFSVNIDVSKFSVVFTVVNVFWAYRRLAVSTYNKPYNKIHTYTIVFLSTCYSALVPN